MKIDLEGFKSSDYFLDRILPLVRDFVFVPRRKLNLPPLWSNNNAESANHMIKNHNDWKQLSVPKLVIKLNEIIKMQDKDIHRALVGIGNYDLSCQMLNHRITVQRWSSMSALDRKNVSISFCLIVVLSLTIYVGAF